MDVLKTSNYQATMIQTSPQHLCHYLDNRIAKFNYVSLSAHTSIETKLYSDLVAQGYRRSGSIVYRPDCLHCQQCISTRIPLDAFKLSRRFRKVLKRNAAVRMTVIPSIDATAEHFSLYASYITNRHADGDMYPPSLHTFESFLVNSIAQTFFIELREPNNKLIAVAVTDQLQNGLSSVYTFYATDTIYHRRSLGIYSILQQISLAQAQSLDYLYLGYWIPTADKMDYKADFHPIELLIGNQWQYFESSPSTQTILELLNTRVVKHINTLI